MYENVKNGYREFDHSGTLNNASYLVNLTPSAKQKDILQLVLLILNYLKMRSPLSLEGTRLHALSDINHRCKCKDTTIAIHPCFRFCFVLRLGLGLRVHPGPRASLGETEEMGETAPLATVEGPYCRQHHLQWKARVPVLRHICLKAQQLEGKYNHSRSQLPRICVSESGY